ncbi:hypothetical protein J8P48_004314 [Salmonella enterica]|nr:hypothetical protein [Salmonella enterica]EHH5279157.1 hypothetical protein [Salmonella enterica]EHH6372464.1 hypothetical protein [Salmonella enterica]
MSWWRSLAGTGTPISHPMAAQANLDVAFGQRPTINPLTARLTGNVAGVMKVFNRCGWQAEPDSGTSLLHQYSLMAGQGVPGKGD